MPSTSSSAATTAAATTARLEPYTKINDSTRKKRKLSLDIYNEHRHDEETPNRCSNIRFTASGTSMNSHAATGQNNIISTNNLPSDIITPDFAKLATIYPEFAKQWRNLKMRQNQQHNQQNNQQPKSSFSTHVDFEFNLALTRAILKEYFQLSLPSLPYGNLCPPIPNRLNYVMWIKDLLREVFDCKNEYFEYNRSDASKSWVESQSQSQLRLQSRSYRGIDIGTGASCIYPLLLSSKYFDGSRESKDSSGNNEHHKQWKFLGTDIDSYSIQCAQENIDANKLQDVIKVALVPPTTHQSRSILSQSKEEYYDDDNDNDDSSNYNQNNNDGENDNLTPIHTAMKAALTVFHNPGNNSKKDTNESNNIEKIHFDFCMTNPPFYSTIDEATKPRGGDARKRTPMTIFESVYPGPVSVPGQSKSEESKSKSIGGAVKFVLDMIHDSFSYQREIIWFTAMLGKKSSYIQIEKELDLLGFSVGSIRRTEFVQGKMIRWGIAWTFRQPSIRSKVTLVEEENRSFNVKFEKPLPRLKALDEISDRIVSFCDNYKGPKLICQRKSENQICLIESDDKSIANNRRCSSESSLQMENPFTCQLLIDVFVITNPLNEVDSNEQKHLIESVTIKLECYCHFKKALGRIHNVKNQMIGDVGRTNRRWRRRYQRERADES